MTAQKNDRGWKVVTEVDDDGHLNIYIENKFSDRIDEIESGRGDGDGEQLASRYTTPRIEDKHDSGNTG